MDLAVEGLEVLLMARMAGLAKVRAAEQNYRDCWQAPAREANGSLNNARLRQRLYSTREAMRELQMARAEVDEVEQEIVLLVVRAAGRAKMRQAG